MVAPAPTMGKTAGPYRCLAPQLVPSWTLSERTLEQCSPSPAAIAAIGPAPIASRLMPPSTSMGKGKRASLEGSFYRAVRVEARTLETNRATL